MEQQTQDSPSPPETPVEQPREKTHLSVITCHPTERETPQLAGSGLAHIGPGGWEIVNSMGYSSIAKAYNAGASRASGEIFIFTHSDVEFLTSRRTVEEAMATAAAENAGVIGIAGARVLRESGIWWEQRDQLSGACVHTDKGQYWMTAFGPYGQVCVLDGVFLMMSRRTFERLGGFDEEIPGWDFYDIDITLRAYRAGLINMTFPLHILHKSVGDTSKKPGWHSNRATFAEKWKSELPLVCEQRVLAQVQPGPGVSAAPQAPSS